MISFGHVVYVPVRVHLGGEMPEAIECPGLVNVAVTGKGGVTGHVNVVFTGAGRAQVYTDATAHDDKPAVTFRNKEWLVVQADFVSRDGLTWEEDEQHPAVIRPRNRSADPLPAATPAQRDAIMTALAATVAHHWTPELDRQARRARATRQLALLKPRRAELARALADMDREIAEHQATLDEKHQPREENR